MSSECRHAVSRYALAGDAYGEYVTNIAMGTEIDNVMEFEELSLGKEDAPTAVALLD